MSENQDHQAEIILGEASTFIFRILEGMRNARESRQKNETLLDPVSLTQT